ncbi:mitochondrial carrier protein MTM1 [Arachis stenosperma]|uniref:mitochondrial carrier protein MTM1 n=1 Tax=Arachis stenosperma TaxID=217475 RepID=UPI0025AC979C|nr:mitochondrial carrier protein MTM1 [Arachis stenosperma]XP_057727410.1 mitochondrial carrier protein MTM1 [Arachis stenosperma]
MVDSERVQNPWIASSSDQVASISQAELNAQAPLLLESPSLQPPPSPPQSSDANKLGIGERAFSAAGAAFISAIIVNPLDVAKTRLQAQAAGVAYSHRLSNMTSRMACFGPNMMFADLRCSPSCSRAGIHGTISLCPPECFRYKGTFDVLYKVVQQEGFSRLWRGTNAGLALAIPTVGIYLPCYDLFRNWLEEFTARSAPMTTPYVPLVAGSLSRSLACATCYPIELARTRMQAFQETQVGKKPPGVFQTLVGVVSHVKGSNSPPQNTWQGYRVLWTGMGAQLARDVPFSAICWSILEPTRRKLLSLVGGDDANALGVLGANFSAGFVAGTLAAGATCPLDVAKTRRQIERDLVRQLRMTTRQTLMEVWRDGGMKGLFTGLGPRIGRAGPSVGIVVSFYEVVKFALHAQR